MTPDPMEQMIQDALEDGCIAYRRDHVSRLDFFLPDLNVHIEVKRMHSDRIAKQMSRAPNVIAVQGLEAVQMMARLLRQQD